MGKSVSNIIDGATNHSKGVIAFGSDHAGYTYKEMLKDVAKDWGYTVIDCGTHSSVSVDYPDYIEPVVKEVLAGARGVLICGSGIGMSVGANRFKGINAALCMDSLMAKQSRAHNNANILVLAERLIGQDEALACFEVFLNTAFENGRHQRRVEKLDEFK